MDFKRRCYELYQLNWMKSHGYSLQDVFNILREGYTESCVSGTINSGTSYDDDFDCIETYFEEQGFNGELFVSEKEFYDYEYLDSEYMKSILPEDMWNQYCLLHNISMDYKSPLGENNPMINIGW